MTEYLSLKEFGEIHGWGADSIRVEFKKDFKRPENKRKFPIPDVIVGGGRLRGLVPGLPPEKVTPGARDTAVFGFLPETALNWEQLGRGARTDLIEPVRPGASGEFSDKQVLAAKAVIAANYAVIALLDAEPFDGDEHLAWEREFARAETARKTARAHFVATFPEGVPVPLPQQVLVQAGRV